MKFAESAWKADQRSAFINARTLTDSAFRIIGILLLALLASAFCPGGNALAVAGSQQGGIPESGGSRPEFTRFHDWTSRYLSAAGANAKQDLIAEGRALAKQRRGAFLELIKSDPAQAIASTVPAAVRKRLPAEILTELETRVSGIGDFLPVVMDRAPGGPPVEPIQRFMRLNQKTYRAYVYGRRIWQMTKYGIPLHGVAIDRFFALAESSLRELEPEEASENTSGIANLANRASGVNGLPVLAEMGGRIYRFASAQHLLEAEGRLEAAETGIGPKPIESAAKILELGQNSPIPRTAAGSNGWTIGNKNLLVIRVDFSDLPGDPTAPGGWGPYTAAVVQGALDSEISPFFLATSYGRTSITGIATTQLYRMPQTAEYYATTEGGIIQCILDAEAIASPDYNIANYDRIGLLTSYLGNIPGSQINYGGNAGPGGPTFHANGYFDFRVPSHELGHTYGLLHANLWQVHDSNPVSGSGIDTEYGDDFDVMGNCNDGRCQFSPWFKNILEWFADDQVRTVTMNGVYRVYRFDTATPAAGPLALKIPRDVTRDYWIGCRRNYVENASMQNGAYITWGYHFTRQSDLLDMTTPGSRPPGCDPVSGGYACMDAALPVGSIFTDPDEQISIEVVDQGGSGNAQYIDVKVTLRSRTVLQALNSDPGWTRQGEWAFGMPTGQGGGGFGYPDPTGGATGTNVFGVNLNGNFSTAVGGPYYLIGGPFNFTGYTHSKLQFARWLNSDYPPRFRSTVDVSSNGTIWTPVWEANWEVTDSSWTQQSYGISAVADNQSAFFVRWSYNMTEPGNPYSGWNIDDIKFNAVSSPVLSNSLDVDPGWTRQGQWAFGTPGGGGGISHGNPDPTSGVTGTKVFGVNLSGDYSLGVGGPFYLTAGPFNFTGLSNADLHFARWLNTDHQPNALATVEVSRDGTTWNSVWNSGTSEITDSQWSYVDYDISPIADFQPHVYVRWGYAIGANARPYSGWNIDDVVLFAIPKPITVSGTVIYCSNPALPALPHVTLAATGSTSGSTLSDASGNYQLSFLVIGGSYTVTPTETDLMPASADINTIDVIAVQRHFLVIGNPLSGCRLNAADVNGDTRVNTIDAVAIQRFFLSVTGGHANVGKYKFTPASRTYSELGNDQTDQNYNTIVFGDVASPFVQ